MALFSLAARAGIPAARSALRFLSRMKKPPSGGVTLYRGEPLKQVLSKAETAKMYNPSKIPSKFDFNNPELRKLAMGRWFSPFPKTASRYAGNPRFLSMFKNPKDVLSWGGGYQPGVIKKLTLSAKQAKVANRLANRLHAGKKLGPEHMIDYMYVVPKKSLARAETDKLKTFIANFYRMIGKKHGGLARILEV
tara:strand:+ start:123 stop:701 length:579 start_codon:yes stop_codon:yes gene_type:complete